LSDGTESEFVGDHKVFDWPQTNDTHTGQLHSALAALERWLCMAIDSGADVAGYMDRILRTSHSTAALGVLVNVGKYRPPLLGGPLRPLIANWDLYLWDDYRQQALPYRFIGWSWAQQGDMIFQMARDWTLASYRERALRSVVPELVNSDAELADFVIEATQRWQMPTADKAALEQRVLVAELDARNYRPAADGQGAFEFVWPEGLTLDIRTFNQNHAPVLQTLHLPDYCRQLLSRPTRLSERQAPALASVLSQDDSALGDLDADFRQLARVAVASTLIARAAEWLSSRPEVHEQVREIIQAALSVTENGSDLRARVGVSRGELEFVAHAVFGRWISGNIASDEGASDVLKLLTSGDEIGTRALMALAYRHRAVLGTRWWRLLYLGLLRSGLSVLAPRFNQDDSIATCWPRWSRWLRTRRLNQPGTTVHSIDPLAIAKRIERLERDRWRREYAREDDAFRIDPDERSSWGLSTSLLEWLFGWLLQDRPGTGDALDLADADEHRRLAIALWSFEAWHTYRCTADRERERITSHLGYDIVATLARMVPGVSVEAARQLWEPIFRIGTRGHHAIEYFISTLLVEASAKYEPATFALHWRSIIEYALEADNWYSGRGWFYGQRIIRKLLGCGHQAGLDRTPAYQAIVVQMRDLYERWAILHLGGEEDNVVAFCEFLSSATGRGLRLDGIKWLFRLVRRESSAGDWLRPRTGNSLVEFLDILLNEDRAAVRADPGAIDAVLSLVAHLVARQIPAALALQERVRRAL
jgi:hypothetical protein